MREIEFLQCLHFSALLDDSLTSQSIPIVLPIETSGKVRLEGEDAIALTYQGR